MERTLTSIRVSGVVVTPFPKNKVPKVRTPGGDFFHLRDHHDMEVEVGDVLFEQRGELTNEPFCPECYGKLFIGDVNLICVHCEQVLVLEGYTVEEALESF